MSTVVSSHPPAKLRWADVEEDEDGKDLDSLLPPVQVVGPDANGIKRIVDYKFDGNSKVNITADIHVRKLSDTRLSKSAVERRSWPKFGDAVREDVGARLTVVSTEEILLERPRAPDSCSKADESNAAGDPLAQLGGAVLMLCRTCGKKGDHWTSRCPYKDLAQQSKGSVDTPPTDAPAAAGSSNSSTYIPPGMRTGAERTGTEMRRRHDENSVRVTNLSEDTREPDLHELFQPYGPLSRVYVAYDQKTGMSRGLAFVNFVHKEDAQRAIDKLNGYGYDNLILKVEWATPRAN